MPYVIQTLRLLFRHLLGRFYTVWVWVRALYRSVRTEGLDYRATSLAYATLLTIVPGLALIFALLKAFGVNRHLEPFLLEMLTPLGDKAVLVTDKILDFVTRVNVGVLGFMGLFTLLSVSFSMLSKIEIAFNHIWRITEPRSLGRRAGDYISVILLGPLLMFSAAGLTASMPGADAVRRLIAHEPFGTLFFLGGKLLSMGLVIAAFSCVYLYLPNTRVPWRAALLGGTVGGLAWKLAGLMFAQFITTSSSYHAIYSSLVIVILFMIWLDMSWLILLLGGQAAMFFQHPYYLNEFDRFQDLGSRVREGLGLSVMTLIARRFVRNEPPCPIDALTRQLALPWVTVKDTLDLLQRGGLVEATGRPDDSYLPARDIAGITLGQILNVMRSGGDNPAVEPLKESCVLPEVSQALVAIEKQAVGCGPALLSLRELAMAGGVSTVLTPHPDRTDGGSPRGLDGLDV